MPFGADEGCLSEAGLASFTASGRRFAWGQARVSGFVIDSNPKPEPDPGEAFPKPEPDPGEAFPHAGRLWPVEGGTNGESQWPNWQHTVLCR